MPAEECITGRTSKPRLTHSTDPKTEIPLPANPQTEEDFYFARSDFC
jgi:hypothetical protein